MVRNVNPLQGISWKGGGVKSRKYHEKFAKDEVVDISEKQFEEYFTRSDK